MGAGGGNIATASLIHALAFLRRRTLFTQMLGGAADERPMGNTATGVTTSARGHAPPPQPSFEVNHVMSQSLRVSNFLTTL